MTTTQVLSTILDNCVWLILLSTSTLFITNKRNYSLDSSLIILLVCIIMLWTIIGLIRLNKLLKIDGTNAADNRSAVIEILKDEFPTLKIDDSGQRIIRHYIQTGLFSWGKQITVLFHENSIYMNITTIGRHEIKSPFHAIFNHWTLIRIRNKFKNSL